MFITQLLSVTNSSNIKLIFLLNLISTSNSCLLFATVCVDFVGFSSVGLY